MISHNYEYDAAADDEDEDDFAHLKSVLAVRGLFWT